MNSLIGCRDLCFLQMETRLEFFGRVGELAYCWYMRAAFMLSSIAPM